MSRNPNWTRDELILALNLYFQVNPVHTNEKHPAIVELSTLLNVLPIHHGVQGTTTNFRNPNGVYMKLCNFLRLDPSYKGAGLDAGSKLDQIVWDEFAGDRERLAQVAHVLQHSYDQLPSETEEIGQIIDIEEFPEGRILTRFHMLRERNSRIVDKKKNIVQKSTGRLACEVCDFDFQRVYGDLGVGFAECHHKLPLSKLLPGQMTHLDDLAIVCANCHRMLHRSRPVLTITQLRERLSSQPCSSW